MCDPHVGGPKTVGDGGPRSWDGDVADPLETHCSPTCTWYRVKFGCSRSNLLGVGMGSQKLGGHWGSAPWGEEVAELLEICFSPFVIP